jgi:hypothetical protein
VRLLYEVMIEQEESRTLQVVTATLVGASFVVSENIILPLFPNIS